MPQHYIEREVRLSSSLLWDLQTKNYQSFGPECWTRLGVPLHATSNPKIARQYAAIAAFALQLKPLSFLELGGGSGRFAYLFLQEILSQTKAPICYHLTDLAEKNILFWENHPLFAPYLTQNILKLSIYDALKSPPLSSSPLFVIANYFFDSIPQDLFKIQNGDLYEGRLSLNGTQDSYTYHPIDAPSKYYPSPIWNELLLEYASRFTNTTFLFPIGALQVLENLSAHQTHWILLASDKGYTTEEQIEGWQNPGLEFHGTFSFPVNFHLLKRFIEKMGGEAISLQSPNPSFSTMLLSSHSLDKSLKDFFQKQPQINSFSKPSFEDLEKIEDPQAASDAIREEINHFFPLCQEESLQLYNLEHFCKQKNALKEAAEIRDKISQLQMLPNQSRLLKTLHIGNAPVELPKPDKTLSLSEINPWPLSIEIFDEIYFFGSDSPKKRSSASFFEKAGRQLVEKIEQQWPSIHAIVYSDEDIELLFQHQTVWTDSTHYLSFFKQLAKARQITKIQYENVLKKLQKMGIIHPEETSVLCDAIEICLSRHMKKGSVFTAYLSSGISLSEDQRFLDIIKDRPGIDWQESPLDGMDGLTVRLEILRRSADLFPFGSKEV